MDSASGGQHVLILILGFLALIEFGTRPDYPFPTSLTSATLTTSKPPRPSDAHVERSQTRKAAEKTEETPRGGARKEDPKAPKRALSAYMFFVQDWRERIKAENPDASFGMSFSFSKCH